MKYNENKIVKIDSRPSDAIAIAVRTKCKILSAEHVLESAGLRIQSIDDEVKKFKNFLENVSPEDFEIK